ncbi:unnamed protein product [Musa acuminata subsp. burmannicoides]
MLLEIPDALPLISSSRSVRCFLRFAGLQDFGWGNRDSPPLSRGAAVPVIIAGHRIRVKGRHAEEQRLRSAQGREKNSDEIFVCERVCTSKRMLNKVGAFSKDPILDTCVTVCGSYAVEKLVIHWLKYNPKIIVACFTIFPYVLNSFGVTAL